VIDRKGKLDEIKFTSGRQAFLAKLQQLITLPATANAEPQPSKPPLPADRAGGFAAAARERINGALVRCEERYPTDAVHSVLYVVVEKDAPLWRAQLSSLHEEYFGPGKWDPLTPVRLEVIDRATDEALQRLIEAGVVARTTRGNRPLFPAEATLAPPPLSPADLERIRTQRGQATRKLKMAGVLEAAGLAEEAREALLEGLLPLVSALASERRLPEPASLKDALLPPVSGCWREALPEVHTFLNEPAGPCATILAALQPLAQPSPDVAGAPS